jgi:hypothetical protein
MLEVLWRRRGWTFLYVHSASFFAPCLLVIAAMAMALGTCLLGIFFHMPDALTAVVNALFDCLFSLAKYSFMFYLLGSPVALAIAVRKNCYESKFVAGFPLLFIPLCLVGVGIGMHAPNLIGYLYWAAWIYIGLGGILTLGISGTAVSEIGKIILTKDITQLGCGGAAHVALAMSDPEPITEPSTEVVK